MRNPRSSKKLVSIDKASEISKKYKAKGKTVGLITGCFDILHHEHINLLRELKKQVDVLIIGLQNDEKIKLGKGYSRPIFTFDQRAILLSELESVDYLFKIDGIVLPSIEGSGNFYDFMYSKILPSKAFLNAPTSSYKDNSEKLKTRCDVLGIEYVELQLHPTIHTTDIIKKIRGEI